MFLKYDTGKYIVQLNKRIAYWVRMQSCAVKEEYS